MSSIVCFGRHLETINPVAIISIVKQNESLVQRNMRFECLIGEPLCCSRGRGEEEGLVNLGLKCTTGNGMEVGFRCKETQTKR